MDCLLSYPTSDPYGKYSYSFYIFLCYSFFFSIISMFFYVIELQKKTSFYFQTMLKDQVKSLNNIFENTSIGYLSIKNNKIIYMNSFLKKSLQKFRFSLENSELVSM